MIKERFLLEWAEQFPWRRSEQVEQELLISRAVVAIYSDPYLAERLAWRGGTIKKIATGKTVIADDVEQLLSEEESIPDLSPRQREILESITRGLSNAQIALQLDISAESVKTHMSKLFAKLGAATRAEAAAIALRKHLLKI